MKMIIGTIFVLEMLASLYCLFKTYKTNHRLTHVVRRIIQLAILNTLCHTIIMFSKNELVCRTLYCAYFAMSLWMMYYLFRFSLEFIGNEFEKYVKKKLMLLLLTADTISIAVNWFTGHLFTMKMVPFRGELFYKISKTPFYYTHYALILMLIVFCLISLLYRSVKSPLFYRRKYLAVAIILLIIILFNMNSSRFAVDLSLIGYTIECITIYYCAFVYSPQRLLPTTLFKVAQDMSVALFVLDMDGKELYANNYAQELLNEKNLLVNRQGITLSQWCRRQYMENSEEFTVDHTFYRHRDNQEFNLKIQLQRMKDTHKQVQGGYFTIQDCTEEINKLKKERYLATHDTLTGLYNKEFFYTQSQKYITENPDEDLLMICTDIKDFKMINDFLGTKIGDMVLINFAKTLKENVRGAIMYGRLGNDIFGVLMSKTIYNEEIFIRHAQDIFTLSLNEGVSFPMVNYVGVYEITERTIPISVMCDRARMAINSIKGDYSKRIAYYDNVLRDNILREQELISSIDDAIENGQIQMYLQPQMSSDGKLLGAEALVRWIHPEKGVITPGEFIPIFEKNGLISKVDTHIWELACKQLQKWKIEGHDDLHISVNISPKDFYFLNIYEILTNLVSKYGISTHSLKLEITETAVVMDFDRQLDLISKLRNEGFIVEMDDFGSGYSSLNMLKDIRVDILKIDMVFLEKSEDEARSRKILQMIINLSNQLGMPVITEGVETEEQLKFLSEMGCNMFQGYYFAKPMAIDKFEEKYFG